jgi:hypothetical protein
MVRFFPTAGRYTYKGRLPNWKMAFGLLGLLLSNARTPVSSTASSP